MKILAIDSSSAVASVALVDEESVIAEYSTNVKKTHSQTLLPMIEEILRATGVAIEEVDAFAAAAGPGSFTGLRIGAATVKGLAMATEKPIVGVPTMEAMAQVAWGVPGLICPMMDARRDHVFTGLYRFEADEEGHDFKCVEVMAQCPLSMDDLIDVLNEKKEQVTFVGDAIVLHRERLSERLEAGHVFAAPHRSRNHASAVAACTLRKMKDGEMQAGEDFAPIYLRLSQAEREKAQR